jgi:hypothetical protein
MISFVVRHTVPGIPSLKKGLFVAPLKGDCRHVIWAKYYGLKACNVPHNRLAL